MVCPERISLLPYLRSRAKSAIEWSKDDSVWYDIVAFSEPRQWQAKIARPVTRLLQKRFAADSKTAMIRAIGLTS
jgi:uncharacterized protein (UPF0548 family)